MSQTIALSVKSNVPRLRGFSPAIKVVWTALVVATVVTELVPISPMAPSEFYFYNAAKLMCFFAMGYLAPLAFWRFNALTRGLRLATLLAACVECLQGFVHHGHSFHWYELVVKLMLVLFGFAVALEARYERNISVGPIHIYLTGDQLDQ